MSKQGRRETTWRLLEIYRAARFPGAKGGIPNFIGAERATVALGSLGMWESIEMLPHGILMAWIVTPEGAVQCGAEHPKSRGIYREHLAEEEINAVPVLMRPRSARTG